MTESRRLRKQLVVDRERKHKTLVKAGYGMSVHPWFKHIPARLSRCVTESIIVVLRSNRGLNREYYIHELGAQVFTILNEKYRLIFCANLFEREFFDTIRPWVKDRSQATADAIIGGLELGYTESCSFPTFEVT